MSDTPQTAVTTSSPVKAIDSLLSPQFILLNEAMALVAMVAGAVIWRGDASQVNLVLGAVIGYGSAVMQFYFGSSRSSQAKDDVIANKGGTTTTTSAPSTVVVTPTTPNT